MPILAADIGTTTMKVAVVDENLNFLHFRSSEVPVLRGEPLAAEHDPEYLFGKFLEMSREAVSSVGGEIEGVVLSGYLFGLVGVDRQGKPVTNVITWLDRRPVEVLGEVFSRLPPREVYEKTGCPPLYIYQLVKMYWLSKRRRELYDKVEYFLDAKGYILYRLTGELVFEKSSASGSQLFNTRKLEWEVSLLDELGLDPSKLPELVEGDEVLGAVRRDVAERLGIGRDVPVVPGIFDGASVAVGEGALSERVGSSHLSTSTMLRVASSQPVVDKSEKMRFQTYYAFGGTWLPGGALNNAGVTLRWFRDNFGHLERIISEDAKLDVYDLLTREAERTPPGSDGLIFLPFLVGERIPEFGNEASAVLFGLREHHTRAHVLRSFLEGVAFNLNMVKEALEENSLRVEEVRVTGGGAKSRLWLQILADVLGVPVHRVHADDAALSGAAMLCMKALGKIRDVREFSRRNVKIESTFLPAGENAKVYMERYRLYKLVLEHVKPLFALTRA